MRNLEEAFTEDWQAYFERQGAVVVAQLKAKRIAMRLAAASDARELRADVSLFDADEIDKWQRQALALARQMDRQASALSMAKINRQFGVSFSLKDPFIQDFINARANQLAGNVTSTTYQAIQQALTDGVAQGASIDDLAAAVEQVFSVASSSRARTIARTEVIGAANGSHTLASQQLPSDVAAGRIWISTSDDRTREEHADADGQVVGMHEPFMVGGDSLMYPGDPNGTPDEIINCRCTIGTLTPDEFASMRGRPQVTEDLARTALRMIDPATFDPGRFRRALLAVA